MRTQDLIAALAADTPPHGPSLGKGLRWAALGAILLGALAMQAGLGIRGNFVASLSDPRFLFKFVVTSLLAAATFRCALSLARPQAAPVPLWIAIGLPCLVLTAGVLVELALLPPALWMPRLVGQNALLCLVSVPLIAIAPLAVVLLALRRGASPAPRRAGLMAGIASGALGAFFYAAHCPDDSPLFVAAWYVPAICLVALLGATVGARLLRW